MELGGAVTIFLALCLSCLLVLIAWKRMNKAGKLPPGPTPIPFLGNLLQVRTDATFQSFMKLREKYGPLFTVYMGLWPVVVLCGHEAVKEALIDQTDEFNGHGKRTSIEQNFQGHGVALASGERWRILRRFSLTIFWDFRMGKRNTEECITVTPHPIFMTMASNINNFHCPGAPIDPTFLLSCSVSNIISSVVFGSCFDYEDKQFLNLLRLINESFIEMSTPWAQLYDMYSGIMPYLPGRHNRVYYLMEQLKDFIASRVKINEASFDSQNPRDFFDCFLIKMHQVPPLLPLPLRPASHLFFSNSDSPIHKEINQVIVPHRLPSVDNRVKMPYTDAIQRLVDIVPMGVPHNVIRDTQFRGYLLPEGTDVFPLLGSVLKDPKYFCYPEAFYPQHFPDELGRFKKNEAFVPFSSGKRICLGEAMARMELFLYFTSILQNFSPRSLVPPADIDVTPKLSGFGNIPLTMNSASWPLSATCGARRKR
uniref:Uncharacterized protein n=1 Tax=Cercocebus atys TaxID=9531 RepID=A0A2K5NYI6_CERAT